jgi:2-amino-4-hydroxy-6-hydroxymethyldihydropteridine diphosphokinase
MIMAYVGVGSNIDKQRNVRSGLRRLEEEFGELRVSPVYRTPAVGFAGAEFYNLVVGVRTDATVHELVDALKAIEREFGRDHTEPKFSSRTLDLDLLTYGDLVLSDGRISVPRDDIDRYAFVLKPLAEIAPEEYHPIKLLTYRALWEARNDDGARLTLVEDWQGTHPDEVNRWSR